MFRRNYRNGFDLASASMPGNGALQRMPAGILCCQFGSSRRTPKVPLTASSEPGHSKPQRRRLTSAMPAAMRSAASAKCALSGSERNTTPEAMPKSGVRNEITLRRAAK